jgi:holliday junction DNA helicase RuvA
VIASVTGRVAGLGPDSAVVEVGGVGLMVSCAPNTLAGLRLGEQATLSTSLVVREDSLTLYGFADVDERQVFELVQTVTGIGPRLAQSMLAVHSPDQLRRAVMTEDLVALTKVPGVGRKGAQRIVLELKDRLGPPRGSVTGGSAPRAASSQPGSDWQGQVHSALLGLGWSVRDADEAVSAVALDLAENDAENPGPDGDSTEPEVPDVAALLKTALRSLSRA